MQRFTKLNLYVLIIFYCFSLLQTAQATGKKTFEERIKSLPDVESVRPIKHNNEFSYAYEIKIRQHLDHNNPNSEIFLQKVYLYDRSQFAPMVISTEGYSAREYITEPTKLLKANQIIVENRFFVDSKPKTMDWKFLTSEQCAKDLHHITTIFKNIYHGKWISTGISKGGQTCLFYRYYFPNDVNATIAYVAPINLAQENPVINRFISSEVGTKECRDKITQFQIELLKNRKKIIPMVKKVAEEKSYKFSIGLESAFEFAVLEYPFSFWQWGQSNCDQIPGKEANPKQLFDELNKVSGFSLFSDKEAKYLGPLFYQSFTELGYYNFDYNSKEVLNLLETDPKASYKVFLPHNIPVVYNPDVLKNIYSWLQEKGRNIIYVNGGNDPWSGGAGMRLKGKTNSFEVLKDKGTHATRIKDLSVSDKAKVYTKLSDWLGKIIN